MTEEELGQEPPASQHPSPASPQDPAAIPQTPPSPYPPPGVHPQAQPTNGLAVTAMVLGIVGIFLFFILVLSVLAIIFGALGLKKAGEMNGSGKGMAITGLVLGILTVVWWAFWLIVIIGAGASASGA